MGEEESLGVSKGEKKWSIASYIILIFVAILCLMFLYFVFGWVFTGEHSGILCKNVIREYKGCDLTSSCRCLHYSWGGFGSCDTCECKECLVGG